MHPIILVDEHYLPPNQAAGNYVFNSTGKKYHWPMRYGNGLGQGGAWNFLWRLGFHPQRLSIQELPKPSQGSILFVDRVYPLEAVFLEKLYRWMQDGGLIIATGELEAWQDFFPAGYRWKKSFFDNPYAAMAYLVGGYEPQLVAPPRWNFIEYEGPLSEHLFIGQLAAVQGERQTPTQAILTPIEKAPALIRHQSFYYLNGQPFAAFQAWLQGQEDLSPWLAWRPRLFWLDEWISFFCDLLMKCHVLTAALARPGIHHLNKTTVILRHDLDYSRDLIFLTEENKRNIPATYAVLKDKNTAFWIKKLKPFAQHEIALHYNTGKRNWLGLLRFLITKKSRTSYLADTGKITAKGLLKQLQWAKRQGMNIQTLHRHLCYLIYPEWVDGMDAAFESDSNLRGSSSLFQAHTLRWGIDRVEGIHGFLNHWPDTPSSVWYPFKLAHAGKNGKLLKGWEMTSLMEIEPVLFEQLITHKVKHISHNVFTLIFHPAHAQQASFYAQGSLEYFQEILNIMTRNDVDVCTMSDVFAKASAMF